MAYLVKNFGPDAKPRAVRTDKEMPSTKRSSARRCTSSTTCRRIRRDRAPNRPSHAGPLDPTGGGLVRTCGSTTTATCGWSTADSPHRLVKLDPRTGEQKAWVLPDPQNGIHEVMIDQGA